MNDKEIEKSAFILANDIQAFYDLHLSDVPDIEKMIMDEFRRFDVKDSTPEGLTVAEIFKIIASTAESRSEGLTYNNTIIIATAIHAAQDRKGKDSHEPHN